MAKSSSSKTTSTLSVNSQNEYELEHFSKKTWYVISFVLIIVALAAAYYYFKVYLPSKAVSVV